MCLGFCGKVGKEVFFIVWGSRVDLRYFFRRKYLREVFFYIFNYYMLRDIGIGVEDEDRRGFVFEEFLVVRGL